MPLLNKTLHTMLIVNKSPFLMEEGHRKEYGRKTTYMFPKSAISIDQRTGKVSMAQAIGIPAEYRMIHPQTKVQQTVRYYESSYWDETLKREVYSPENIMITNTGQLHVPSENVELNYFLQNHPGLEEGKQRKNGLNNRYPIIFRCLDKPKHYDNAYKVSMVKKEVLDLLDPNGKAPFDFNHLLAACETISSDQDLTSIPHGWIAPMEVHSWREFREAKTESEIEDATLIMRGVLTSIAEAHPQYAKDKMILAIDNKIRKIIFKASMTLSLIHI
jgi:hypothetical protein